jgi:hypothetical protein
MQPDHPSDIPPRAPRDALSRTQKNAAPAQEAKAKKK